MNNFKWINLKTVHDRIFATYKVICIYTLINTHAQTISFTKTELTIDYPLPSD